jgi:simple sugar transport system ATP-binding protein
MSPSIDRAAATLPQIGEWMSGLWEGHKNKKEAAHV